jgi:hypothetical protein
MTTVIARAWPFEERRRFRAYDRAIQYAAAPRTVLTALEYWIPRFRGE